MSFIEVQIVVTKGANRHTDKIDKFQIFILIKNENKAQFAYLVLVCQS